MRGNKIKTRDEARRIRRARYRRVGEFVAAGEVTAAELAALARAAYDALNPKLNAILEFYEDAESVRGADSGIFPGVPFLRKDVGATEAGRLQEIGSRLFQGHRPAETSYYIERAWAGGLRIIGRSAVPELATSGFTESIVNGITGNPWNLARTAGGSTGGGSAAASEPPSACSCAIKPGSC